MGVVGVLAKAALEEVVGEAAAEEEVAAEVVEGGYLV